LNSNGSASFYRLLFYSGSVQLFEPTPVAPTWSCHSFAMDQGTRRRSRVTNVGSSFRFCQA